MIVETLLGWLGVGAAALVALAGVWWTAGRQARKDERRRQKNEQLRHAEENREIRSRAERDAHGSGDPDDELHENWSRDKRL